VTALAAVQSAQDATIPGSLVVAALVAVVVVAALLTPALTSRLRQRSVIRGAEQIAAGHDPRTCDCEATR
jgi:hypothetical protein